MRLRTKVRDAVNGIAGRQITKGGRRAIVRSYQPPSRLPPGSININIGAGPWHHRDWIALDMPSDWYHGSGGAGFTPYDILKDDLPFADASVDLAYCSAVIEHIPDAAAEQLLGEVARVLKPGGGFRLVMPDAAFIYHGTIAGPPEFWSPRHDWARDRRTSTETDVSKWTPMDFLVRELATARCRFYQHVKAPVQPRELEGLSFEALVARLYEGVGYDYDHPENHINWWTHEKLVTLAERFALVPFRSGFGQSLFPAMRDVAYFDGSEYWLNMYADLVPATAAAR